MERKFRVVSTGGGDADERWHDAQEEIVSDIAARLGLAAEQVAARRLTVSLDPVVVMHDGTRWRSRDAWQYRPANGTTGGARVYEMIRIDEAQYDH